MYMRWCHRENEEDMVAARRHANIHFLWLQQQKVQVLLIRSFSRKTVYVKPNVVFYWPKPKALLCLNLNRPQLCQDMKRENGNVNIYSADLVLYTWTSPVPTANQHLVAKSTGHVGNKLSIGRVLDGRMEDQHSDLFDKRPCLPHTSLRNLNFLLGNEQWVVPLPRLVVHLCFKRG